MAQVPQKSCDICHQAPGNYFCLECEEIYCNNCKLIHGKQKLTKNHEFQLASDGIPESKSKCKDHKESFNLFCSTCDVSVCTKCITGKHQGHKISEIQDTVKGLKEKLEKELKPKVQRIDQNSKQILDKINQIDNESSSVIQALKKDGERMKAVIDQHINQMVASVQAEVTKEKSRLQKIHDDMKTTSLSVRSLEDQRQTLDQSRPDGTLIDELKSLLSSVEKLSIFSLPNSTSLKYLPPSDSQGFAVEKYIGRYKLSGGRQGESGGERREDKPDRRYDSGGGQSESGGERGEDTLDRKHDRQKKGFVYRCRTCRQEQTFDKELPKGPFLKLKHN